MTDKERLKALKIEYKSINELIDMTGISLDENGSGKFIPPKVIELLNLRRKILMEIFKMNSKIKHDRKMKILSISCFLVAILISLIQFLV